VMPVIGMPVCRSLMNLLPLACSPRRAARLQSNVVVVDGGAVPGSSAAWLEQPFRTAANKLRGCGCGSPALLLDLAQRLEHLAQLAEHALALGLVAALRRMHDAVVHVIVEHHQADLVERCLHRLNLVDNVDA